MGEANSRKCTKLRSVSSSPDLSLLLFEEGGEFFFLFKFILNHFLFILCCTKYILTSKFFPSIYLLNEANLGENIHCQRVNTMPFLVFIFQKHSFSFL